MSKKDSIHAGAWALALSTSDGLQRQVARDNLVAMGRAGTLVLIRLLQDNDSRVRSEAALALKDLADPLAAEALVEAMKDENGDVRWVAAEALAAVGEKSLLPLLRSLVRDADSFELRDAAHVAIHLLKDDEQRALLAPVYRATKNGSPPEVVMMAAARALEAVAAKVGSAA